jgi:hypothetical protein
MAFGFSSSKQSSQSQSSSLDYGISRSSSLSSGTSQATGQSGSTQRIAFEDIIRNLYGGAADATSQAVAEAPLFAGEAQQLFTGGLGFLERLQNVPGSDYLQSRIMGSDTAAAANIDVLGANLGKFFNEQLMPAITSRGVSTGTLGGSRQGVAIGRAAGEVGSQFSTGVASILASSQAARDAAAGTLGSQSIAATGTGLAALPSILGLAGAGANAGLTPYLALSQIIGGPTVLTESQSQSQSSSQDLAQAISNALSYGTSQSTASSKGKSLGFSFSPGLAVS